MAARGWLGHTHIDLAICASTNDEAARLATRGVAHGTVVTARMQTAGRGRMGRSWFSPEDENLYYSCVLRPGCRPADAPPITLAAGLGVADAVEAMSGLAAALKWPNDILVNNRKLAGVLTETSVRGQRLEYVIVGIGVNLGTREFPRELRDIATSIRRERGESVDRAQFIASLSAHAESWFDRFFERGSQALVEAWMERARSRDHGLGREIRATMANGQIVGRIVGLASDGQLRVRDRHGRVHTIAAGAIEYRD